MELKDIQSEYNGIVKQVRDLQAEWDGKTEPQEVRNQIKAFGTRMDELDAQMDEAREWKTEQDRIARHMGKAAQGTGHVPFAVDAERKSVGAIEVKGGWAGVTTKAGVFTPLYREAFLESRSDVKTAFDPQYAKVFDNYLRGLEAEMEPAEKRLLRQGTTQGKALTESSNIGGGFAVPVDFIPELIQRLPGLAIFTDKARHITTNRDVVRAPRIKAASTNGTMYNSAVVATMVGENPSASTGLTAPVFEGLDITVNTAKLETIVSRALISDAAFNVGSYLSEVFSETATLFKDSKFLAGTGYAQPVGVVTDPDITSITSAATATVTADDLKELKYRTAWQYQRNGMYFLSLDALRKFREMKDGNGNYLWSPGYNHGVDGGVPDTLEGSPYAVSDFLDTAGTTGNKPIFFGDPRFYWVIDRLDPSIQVLDQLYAESFELAYLMFFRFGGHVVVPEAFRYLTLA